MIRFSPAGISLDVSYVSPNQFLERVSPVDKYRKIFKVERNIADRLSNTLYCLKFLVEPQRSKEMQSMIHTAVISAHKGVR